jgi:hypothetical protein
MGVFLPFVARFPYPEGTANVFERLRDALEGMLARETSPDEMKTAVGRPPYWFLKQISPPYAAFIVGALDNEKRQYMSLSPDQIAVRLPRKEKLLEFPKLGQTITITPRGTGELISVFIYQIDLPSRRNPRTAILEVKYMAY